MVTRQVYIDPVSIRGNIIVFYLWWDWKTRLEVSIEVEGVKTVCMDRFRVIGFIQELMRKTGIEFVMSRERFINIDFSEVKGLKIKIKDIKF